MLKNIFQPLPLKKNKLILTNELTEKESYKFVHLLGYTILALMLVDYVAILFPPQLFNPNWELETIGTIIESIYVTLLGLMLVFFRPQQQFIKYSELKILSLLSWLTLLLGIVCFLFIPLLISDSLRIDQMNQAKINFQINHQLQQAEEMTVQLNNLNTEQIESLWTKKQQYLVFNDNISTAEKKQKLASEVNLKEQENKKKLQQQLHQNRNSLFKMTFKWILGTIIAGVSFLSVWKYTEWIREFCKAEKRELY